MKKSLIALAIASAVSAPAFAATSNVDVYGRMAFSVDFADTNESVGDNSDVVTARDNVSRFGIKGTEDLGGGLAAIWQIETALNADNAGNVKTKSAPTGTATTALSFVTSASYSGGLALRNTFVGLKSDTLGTVILGRHDTPYKLATGALDIFSDTAGDYNTIIGTTGNGKTIYDNRAPQTIAYVSPNWTGFSFAAAYVSVKLNENPLGLTPQNNNAEAYSVMGQYANGPFFASLAYETFTGGSGAGSTGVLDTEAFKAGFGFKMAAFKLGLIYEDISDDASGSALSRDAYYVNGMYSIGAIDLKAAYGISNDGESAADTEFDNYVLGVDYNLSKRTKLFGLYSAVQNSTGSKASLSTTGYAASLGNDVEVFSVGMVHTF